MKLLASAEFIVSEIICSYDLYLAIWFDWKKKSFWWREWCSCWIHIIELSRFIKMSLCWMWNFSFLLSLQSKQHFTSWEQLNNLGTSLPSRGGMQKYIFIEHFFKLQIPIMQLNLSNCAGTIVVFMDYNLSFNLP